MKKGAIIISLGGSLIVPGDINTKFLRSFKKLIEKHVRRGRRLRLSAEEEAPRAVTKHLREKSYS